MPPVLRRMARIRHRLRTSRLAPPARPHLRARPRALEARTRLQRMAAGGHRDRRRTRGGRFPAAKPQDAAARAGIVRRRPIVVRPGQSLACATALAPDVRARRRRWRACRGSAAAPARMGQPTDAERREHFRSPVRPRRPRTPQRRAPVCGAASAEHRAADRAAGAGRCAWRVDGSRARVGVRALAARVPRAEGAVG